MQSTQQKVLAAIVTFNGAKTISETLNALQKQTRLPDAFLVVDNASTDQTLKIIEQLQIKNLKINLQSRNAGVAAAYNLALKEAVADNFDWLWLFDQDSVCEPGCLENLLAEANNIKSDGIHPSVLFPTHYLKSRPDYLLAPWKWNGLEMIDVAKPVNSLHNYTAVHTSMTSGALYSLCVIKNEKGFREAFFIDFVDHEYHMRLFANGYSLFWVYKAQILHSLGKTIVNARGQLLIYHEPWRYFFIGQNMFTSYWKWGGFRAVWHLRKKIKHMMEYYKNFDEIDHKNIWKHFKLGMRYAVFSRFSLKILPKSIIALIR